VVVAEQNAILNQLNIIVGNVPASSDFYRRLGVRIPEPAGQGVTPPFHAECGLKNDFSLDMDVPQFAQIWNAGWAGRDDLVGRVVIGFHFETRDRIDETYADLTGAGYVGLQPPYDAFWGARYAVVEDPNGIAVGLMSPIDPDRRFWPPENWKG
jgi:catechol 2,3-dioxygenase-like lactoylglutathione lyase family enzyme